MKKSIEDLRQKEIDQVHEEIKKMEEKLVNLIIPNKIDPCTEKLTYEAIRKREKYQNEIDGIKVKLVDDISCFYEDVQSKLEQFRKKKHVIFSVENFFSHCYENKIFLNLYNDTSNSIIAKHKKRSSNNGKKKQEILKRIKGIFNNSSSSLH